MSAKGNYPTLKFEDNSGLNITSVLQRFMSQRLNSKSGNADILFSMLNT